MRFPINFSNNFDRFFFFAHSQEFCGEQVPTKNLVFLLHHPVLTSKKQQHSKLNFVRKGTRPKKKKDVCKGFYFHSHMGCVENVAVQH